MGESGIRSGTQSLEGADGVAFFGLKAEKRLEVVEWMIWEMGFVWRVGSVDREEAMNEPEQGPRSLFFFFFRVLFLMDFVELNT